MIRRDVPRNAADSSQQPSHWLLISQIEHARISHQLASAWDSAVVPAIARDEFLACVLHHDDGWDDWRTAPRIDPEHGRPYGFTEMPPKLAQEIWSKSIDKCREIGPLAGWVVASHFIQLQGKPDDDFDDWARWLGEQDRRRTEWLAEWQAIDPTRHTQQAADRCLFLLQVFDWLSLWLCCRGPIDARDLAEELELGDSQQEFGPYMLTPAGPVIEMSPWPFASESLDITANASRATYGRYETASAMAAVPTRAAWRLAPAASRA